VLENAYILAPIKRYGTSINGHQSDNPKHKDTIEATGFWDTVKMMVGGVPIDDVVRQYTCADARRKDAMEAVSLAKRWLRGE